MEDPFATNRLPTTEELASEDDAPKEYRILVAEDSADSAVPISLHLQDAGYQVVIASDGAEAVRVAALTKPDVILMDISMPVLDGLAATRQIREESAPSYIPIIAISAFSTSGFLRAAHDVGFDGYLTKPINFERLDELIKSLLPGQL